jgi:hypothetical protein
MIVNQHQGGSVGHDGGSENLTGTVTKIFPRIGLVRKTGEILADLSRD